MRRLVSVSVLLLAGLAVPARSAAPERAVYHVAGRTTLAPVPAAEWVDREWEAMGGAGPIATDVLRRFDVAAAEDPDHIRFATAVPVRDLDGDRVGDLMGYDTTLVKTDTGYTGTLDLTLYSGRTGVRRWHRHLEHIGLAFVYETPVGPSGRDGLLLAYAYRPTKSTTALRAIGIGARGEVAYDRTISSADDDLGDVYFAGLFDGYPGGGTDLLVGRVVQYTSLGGTAGFNPSELTSQQPYSIDGRDGKVRAVHDPVVGLSGRSGFIAVGDLDGDGRDDVVLVRQGLRETGSLTAYSVVENKTIWTDDKVTLGWSVRLGGVADMAGDAREDFVLGSWDDASPLLHVQGVTEGLPLIDDEPQPGIHGVLVNGQTGAVVWDRVDAMLAFYWPAGDLDGDRKTDVFSAGLVEAGDRDGVRFTAVTGAGKVLYRRDATVPRVPARSMLGGAFGFAGDLDGDRVQDVAYAAVSASRIQQRTTQGFLFVRHGRVVTSDDWVLGGTVDGRGDERATARFKDRELSLTVRDGVRGTPYWTLRATATAGWQYGTLAGARGRCDDVALVAVGQQPGSVWAARIDGATGRVRWKRQLQGAPVRVTLSRSGPSVRCG